MTTFKIDSFKDQYRLALIFSMIEGLSDGKTILVDSQEDPQPLADLVLKSDLPALQVTKLQKANDEWTLKIEKVVNVNSTDVGCCGMCDGGSHQKKV
jgi:uncharacterized protein (DUF2249 family)